MEFKQKFPWHITVRPSANNGFNVEVGCCSLVYTDEDKMLADLREFLAHPKRVIAAYNKRPDSCVGQPAVLVEAQATTAC
jgi:hypothetical protein